jgi:hypothetical protein
MILEIWAIMRSVIAPDNEFNGRGKRIPEPFAGIVPLEGAGVYIVPGVMR